MTASTSSSSSPSSSSSSSLSSQSRFMPSMSSIAATTAGNTLVSTSRLARGREVHAHNIRFAARNNGRVDVSRTAMVVNGCSNEIVGVLHRNANGWLAVALNDDGEPLSPALTDMHGYTPVRTRRVERKQLLGSLLGRLGVRHVYTNDASLLTANDTSRVLGDETNRLQVTGYQGSFVHALETAKRHVRAQRENVETATTNKTTTTGNVSSDKRDDHQQQQPPSYETIRELDPTITRKEYRRIYAI